MNCPNCGHEIELTDTAVSEMARELGRKRAAMPSAQEARRKGGLTGRGGLPRKPTRCKRCGRRCESVRAAQRHCRGRK